MIKALEIPSQVDLARFSAYLHACGLAHRISEEGTNQVVWVAEETEVDFVQQEFNRLESGELILNGEISRGTTLALGARFFGALVRFPLTLVLIITSLVFYPVSFGVEHGDFGVLFSKMTFLAMEQHNGTLYFMSLTDTWATGERWRVISPMFIHFGLIHIVFNLLWVWEIGRRIEFTNGSMMLAGIVLLSSLAANFTQFFMSGPSLFGGMSGVVFGLLGHSLVYSRINPARDMGVPRAIYIFMLVYLVIGFTGAIDLLGFGSLANGAHLGGLLGGLATGAIAGLLARPRHHSS